jgi:transcriptional regulator with XRE-family HTH domain
MRGDKFMDLNKIGKFITYCRKQKNLTQEQLAEKLNITNRAVSKWERGLSLPDASIMIQLCNILDINVNELLSGKIIDKKDYQESLEENIINTIDYTNKKIENKNNFIGLLLIIFGVLISISAVSIFPSESSWGSIYSVFGVIVSLIGVSKFTKRLSCIKRLICNFGYFLIFILLLIFIDYIGVINIHQAPRFSLIKVSGENVIYYDTLFYDVVRCNVNKDNEIYKVIKNQKYDKDSIDDFCK